MASPRSWLVAWAVTTATLIFGAAAPTPGVRADAPASRPPAGDRVLLRGGGEYALGSPRARVLMVEFTDYHCPFCRRYSTNVFPQIKARYVDAGKVRYVVRDLPLDMHEHAFAAAEAARCAGAQGKFWPVRDLLMTRRFTPADFPALAREAGVAAGPFQACLDQDRFVPDIRRDVADALAAGLRATPAFVIGRPGPGGVSGVRLIGARPFEAFAARIDEMLRAR
jgi:protein-disulfide isomerase